RPTMRGIILAVATLAVAAVLKIATSLHILGADSADRSAQMLIGLTLAVWANFIPKTFGPAPSSRRGLRIAGWTFTIAGLLYALVWAVARADVAFPAGIAIVASGIGVTVASCVWLSGRVTLARRSGDA